MIYPNHPQEEGGDRAAHALSCASISRILLEQGIAQPVRARLSVLKKIKNRFFLVHQAILA